jgi:starch synthase (maltosyl-transferring)
MPSPKILHLGSDLAEEARAVERAAALGFDTLLFTPAPRLSERNEPADGAIGRLAERCGSAGLRLFADVDAYALDINHPLVQEHPEFFAIRRSGEGRVIDPRCLAPAHGTALLRPPQDPEPLLAWWSAVFAQYREAGVTGFRLQHPGKCGPHFWEALIGELRAEDGDLTLIADTPGEAREEVAQLAGCGFDYTLSSLPWWDGRAPWLVEEHTTLREVAPVIAQAGAPERLPPAPAIRRGRLALAALTGAGLLMPLGFEQIADAGEDATRNRLDDCVRAANAALGGNSGTLVTLTGPGAPVTVLLHAAGPDLRQAEKALVGFINPDATVSAAIRPETWEALGEFRELGPFGVFAGHPDRLGPGEVRLFRARRAPAVRIRRGARDKSGIEATREPRVVIEHVTPCLNDGFAIKRIAGERVRVEADIFADGHPVLSAELLHRAEDERSWQRVRMHKFENDRWYAHFPLTRMGRHRFAVEAWIDEYGSFVHDLVTKRDAGLGLSLELDEARTLLKRAKGDSSGAPVAALDAILSAFDELGDASKVALLIAPETIETMHRAGPRPHLAGSAHAFIDAERREARFASWYELFPRSMSDDAGRHGTLRDIIPRLASIRDMGFDVLYMTPIHPIGRTNRKGRNNALRAETSDPGSPYAIGSAEGGHDALHPELGTMEDFRALVRAAREHGIELALDFAIQCSPDHPWLKEHPGWFDWRPDGSIKYAENPPKKYEDIVNVDFYKPEAMPGLWCALRDVVLHWAKEGVRIFRVDNPHTKPLPFWRWLIEEVRKENPDVIFLSEAFTRPKLMYRLAKLGFSQSYTYFTWRNTKWELTEYLNELSKPPVSDFFRPHFFVNTPDINPFFLQTSGRPGFLIRAALAATLSGLWGIYSGFELCEAAALPGREEYLDAEKYEIKGRDFQAPGNIISEIARLNAIRKAEPALQTHMGVTFYNAYNDNILYFGKHAPGEMTRILVAVNLDPHNTQECDFEVPLWEWGLSDHEAVEAEDLLRGEHLVWRGKIQHMRITPDAPYAIWRAKPARVP